MKITIETTNGKSSNHKAKSWQWRGSPPRLEIVLDDGKFCEYNAFIIRRVTADEPCKTNDYPSGQGCVYILSNHSMPGLIKVGMTKKTADMRAEDLSRPTGIPEQFTVEAIYPTDNPEVVEKQAHELLEAFHYNKEFYKISVRRAAKMLSSLLQ
jgi:hypothetical protein